LLDAQVPDQYIALGLDFLSRDFDFKTKTLAAIDFKSLGVRQLGSIYEGLLAVDHELFTTNRLE